MRVMRVARIKGLVPTKRQWDRWSLPSRLTALGALFSLVSLALYIAEKTFDLTGVLRPRVPEAAEVDTMERPFLVAALVVEQVDDRNVRFRLELTNRGQMEAKQIVTAVKTPGYIMQGSIRHVEISSIVPGETVAERDFLLGTATDESHRLFVKLFAISTSAAAQSPEHELATFDFGLMSHQLKPGSFVPLQVTRQLFSERRQAHSFIIKEIEKGFQRDTGSFCVRIDMSFKQSTVRANDSPELTRIFGDEYRGVFLERRSRLLLVHSTDPRGKTHIFRRRLPDKEDDEWFIAFVWNRKGTKLFLDESVATFVYASEKLVDRDIPL